MRVQRVVAAGFSAVLLLVGVQASCAQTAGVELNWQPYSDPDTGTRAEFPAGLFTVDAGLPERGSGRVFQTADGRALFAAYALDREPNETPQRYLQRFLKVGPAEIDYRRVTDRFFVVSGVRNGNVYYNRCNFHRQMHCIYMSYPNSEVRAWDGIVTRVSHSLRGPRT